jgi:hypothetical protein
MKSFRTLAVAAAIAAVFVAAPASAESTTDSNATGGYTTTARLDFRVVIPQFISFRVGSAGATVDRVEFDMTSTAGNVGNGADVARTNAGGAAIPVELRSNGGNATVAAAGTTALSNGTTTIAWTEIDGTSDNALFGVPTVGGSVPVAATGGVINQTANWTFTYDNTNVIGAGTYNGQVTYTASNP